MTTRDMACEHTTSASAGPGASRPPRPSAKTVADQFAYQFYKVLERHPRYLHRFYDKSSTLTVSEAGEDGRESVVVAQDLEEIHDRVMELFPEATVRLEAVCPQASVDEGILMLVMGELSRKGKPDCLFAQTLFLAVQNKGFFVLNDIIRLSPINRVRKSTSTASTRPDEEGSPLRREVEKPEAERAPCPGTPARQDSPSSRSAPLPRADRRVVKDAPPALIRAAGPAWPPFQQQPPAARAPVPERPGRPRHAAPDARKSGWQLSEACASDPQRTSSAFVRSIPDTADAEAVAKAFSQFGRLRKGGLKIKQGRRDRFAFVELESVAALDRALTGTVRVNGQVLTVEEKRPMVIRRPGRVKRSLSGHSAASRDAPRASVPGHGTGSGSVPPFHHPQMAHHSLQYAMQM